MKCILPPLLESSSFAIMLMPCFRLKSWKPHFFACFGLFCSHQGRATAALNLRQQPKENQHGANLLHHTPAGPIITQTQPWLHKVLTREIYLFQIEGQGHFPKLWESPSPGMGGKMRRTRGGCIQSVTRVANLQACSGTGCRYPVWRRVFGNCRLFFSLVLPWLPVYSSQTQT